MFGRLETSKHIIPDETECSSRRDALSKLILLPVLSSTPEFSWAATDSPFSFQQAESSQLAVGLLEARVTENVLSPPPYGMEVPDIIYPSWFQGTWQISSRTTDVQAPCGAALFGGNATLERAKNEIGTTLQYDARFISTTTSTGAIVADRYYNVQSIAKAAMGEFSVMDIPVATPNKLTCVLLPKGSPRMLQVDLIALNRRQETISDLQFDCSEVTREIVAPVNNNNAPPQQQPQSNNNNNNNNNPILKEIETTSLYTYNPSKNEITCQQRSATFLLPSQTSPIAYKMWEAARGRPIDTRFYQVRYTKKG
ncbi:expressed unknown protein [Seminavis robusta]|uniref:DUF6816 domain-containing protein n=1 Tax=Seminavis robusta TaxID=568900 RepID=A0A9N8HIX4_9STRA|nr:expressed unknown protein [Seminavis robusta]|eukprot:Sro815_g206580.1 n/a (311) ;mRNA; r:43663-44595